MLGDVPRIIQTEITSTLRCTLLDFQFSSGGCINSGGKLTTTRGDFFIKWNDAEKYPGMFETEALGLQLLSSASAVRIPGVISAGEGEKIQFLVLEFIGQQHPDKHYWQNLGEQLAVLHRTTSDFFGLEFNNYIGSIPQRNAKHKQWLSFFIEERLLPQLSFGKQSGKISNELFVNFEILINKLPTLIPESKTSLLHGDLWSGNVIADERGQPCLIDPATYYGNREAEIAFTKLFGGFSDRFYKSYHSNFPLENDFKSRIDLYNLYPLLVHVNIFGPNYLNQVVSIVKQFV
jgi:fructosamine-3-kinase